MKVSHDGDEWDAVTTTVNLSRLYITDCSVGISTGDRTGTNACSYPYNWGAVSADKLTQPLTQIAIDRCTVVGCYTDGMNLWRAQGEILSTILANNGGEGIHSTHFEGTIRNSVIIGHSDNQLHLHFPREVVFANNLIGAGVSNGSSPGDGLVIGGGDHWLDPPPVIHAYNNVFAGNDGAGARLGFVRLVESVSPCEEEILPCRAKIRNNIFFENASDGDRYAMHVSHVLTNQESDWLAYNLFYDNNGLDYDPAIVTPAVGNIFGSNPLFTSPPDDEILESLIDAVLIRNAAMGVQPLGWSPLIDAGDPDPSFDDVSSYADGGDQCDIGLFGGPYASPSPLSAGARPTFCWEIVFDFAANRVFFRNPLYLEPGGDPWASKISYVDPQNRHTLNLYWVPGGIKMGWLGQAKDVRHLQLGDKRIKLYRTPQEREELYPVTKLREFEVKQWPFESDDPIPQK